MRVDLAAELPRFRLTRLRKDDRSRYFGPFAHSALLRKTLAEMRRRFGILLGDARPTRTGDGTHRLYDDVRAEIYGHANEVTAADYRARVDAACEFLEGKSREWLQTLRAEMQAAADRQEFEQAAGLRDIVQALEETLAKTRRFERAPARPRPDEVALRLLAEALRLAAPPAHLECFDISHISGTFVVASMVHFTAGRPDKDQYRRFQIKSFVGNDDFRAMKEVVGRRYRRLAQEKKPFPDLVVIDGGRGQVAAALKAFLALELDAAAAGRPGQGARDHRLSRRAPAAQPAARPPRPAVAAAPARRGAPLCQHLQRRSPFPEDPRIDSRRFCRPRPGAPTGAARALRLDRPPARRFRRRNPRGPRFRPEARGGAASVPPEPVKLFWRDPAAFVPRRRDYGEPRRIRPTKSDVRGCRAASPNAAIHH